MKIINEYLENKIKNKDSVILIKSGIFYTAIEDDAYIIANIMKYQIKNHKIGFPESALKKVEYMLNLKNINYVVVGENIRKEEFDNKYQEELKIAKRNILYHRNIKNLIQNIEMKILSNEENYKKIKEFVHEL